MLIIGIDPGITGSICFFEDGKIIDVIEMPSMQEGKKNKKQVNGAQVANIIKERLKNNENTYCPGCHHLLVERRGFLVLSVNLKDGCCPSCAMKVPGDGLTFVSEMLFS